MLRASHISKKIDGRAILDDATIQVEPGKITAIIGPSGAGKTTLLKVLSLVESPDAGTVEWDEKNFSFPSAHEIVPPWPLVSVAFQQLFVWPHLTLRQNIELPLKRRGMKGYENRLNELLSLFDMHEFVDRYPNEVSLGQRQRTALVRALALEPKYLLLDEITSSLDIEQSAAILSHLEDVKDRGVGILIVTHHINFAAKASDQVVFMDGARIVEAGEVAILKKPQSERLKKFLSLAKET
jgi:ABC-type polar amino acid transport system ATPase subunit